MLQRPVLDVVTGAIDQLLETTKKQSEPKSKNKAFCLLKQMEACKFTQSCDPLMIMMYQGLGHKGLLNELKDRLVEKERKEGNVSKLELGKYASLVPDGIKEKITDTYTETLKVLDLMDRRQDAYVKSKK